MTTREHVRAFSVAEFSAANRAMREIRAQASNSPLSSQQLTDLFRERIQQIINETRSTKECSQ